MTTFSFNVSALNYNFYKLKYDLPASPDKLMQILCKANRILVEHVGQFRQSKQRPLLPVRSRLQPVLLSYSGHVRGTLSSLGGR